MLREGGSVIAPRHSSGVAEAARGDRNALNTGDLGPRGWPPRLGIKAASQEPGRAEESDEAVVPVKAAKAAGGKGLYLTTRLCREGTEIVATLSTPAPIRKLQRALYRRPAWSLVSRDALRRQRGLERWNLPIARRPADARSAR